MHYSECLIEIIFTRVFRRVLQERRATLSETLEEIHAFFFFKIPLTFREKEQRSCITQATNLIAEAVVLTVM